MLPRARAGFVLERIILMHAVYHSFSSRLQRRFLPISCHGFLPLPRVLRMASRFSPPSTCFPLLHRTSEHTNGSIVYTASFQHTPKVSIRRRPAFQR